ncbi:MAG: FadR family transcriptional regulator [Lentisphaerae bacterium]|nr:FadR family transcriptional regulator [Lentisphaerota bacterium]
MLSKSGLQSNTLADNVENQLLKYMKSASLNPGDLLPREEDLAEHLKVSRHIVREGVSRLKALGLVESRKKRGMIMKRPNAFAGLKKIAEANLFSLREQHEFMELRVALELGMCDFIFSRRTPEKLAELRKVAGLPDSSIHEYNTEIDFHSCLMAIGGNQIANQFRAILMNAFRPIRYKARIRTNRDLKTPTHHQICDILEQGTYKQFHAIMRKHFAPYLKFTETEKKKETI